MNIDLEPKQYLALIKLMNLANAMITNPKELSSEFLDLESYILSFYKDFGLKETDIVKSKDKFKLSYKFSNKYNLDKIVEDNINNALYIKLASLFASREFDEKYKDKQLREKDLKVLMSLIKRYFKELEENGFDNVYIKSSNVIPLSIKTQEKTIDESGEFIDKDHPIETQYDEFIDNPPDDMQKAIKKLNCFIQKDPYFFEPYLSLHQLYYENGLHKKAQEVLDDGYKKAINYIKDTQGNLPKRLRWGFRENRHIIRLLVNRSLDLWTKKKVKEALELFRSILKLNPQDNIGTRYYILAIRMNMSFRDFVNRFDKGGYYDSSIDEWFNISYESFPDEFEWWDKEQD